MTIAQDKLGKPVIVGRGPSGLVYLTRARPGAVSLRSLPLIVRWSFLLFIFSIGFEVSSLTTLIGFLCIASYLLYHNPLSRKGSFPPVPRVMIWFVIYVAVCALNGLFFPSEHLGDFFRRLFQLVAVITFFWIGSDILKDKKIVKKAILAYSIGTVILAVGLVLSLPGFAVTGEVGESRASVMGQNANAVAYVTALAVVALLGVWLSLPRKRVLKTTWMFGSMFVLSLATVYTGSRGGVVMLMLGLLVYTVPYWKTRWRMSTVIVAVIAMAGLAYTAVSTPAFYERWRDYIEEDDTSGRDIINKAALEMISERPLLGWQPVEYAYELGSRTYAKGAKDAHSTYLTLLLEAGIIGAVPFLIGLWLCGQGAWKARNRNLGLLPLALLIASLVGGMSSTTIHLKALWFVLAITVASGEERKRPAKILVGRRIEYGMQTSSLKLNSSTHGTVSGLGNQQHSSRSGRPRGV